MKKFVWLAAIGLVLSTVALANPRVPDLDGTKWQLDVKPDAMAKDKGEKAFKETLSFADGNATLSSPIVGSSPSPYFVTKSGEKDVTFKTERDSAREGNVVWTGTVHGKDLNGKLVFTKLDGSVLTYTFKGEKLD